MKRLSIVFFLIIGLVVFGVSSVTNADQTEHGNAHAKKPAQASLKVAPADEYFGRLKMSILGIANTIKDQSLMYERRPDQVENEMHAIAFVADAIRDWEHKYPRDPWIAKSLFGLERFYNAIPTDEARTLAMRTMVWLVHDFPQTSYGKVGKAEIADGKVGAPLVAQDLPIPSEQAKQ